MVLLALGTGLAVAAWAGDTKTVRLVIDYNDGAEKHFTKLPWKTGLTVLNVLEAAKAHPHGIDVEFKDYGPQAGFMVTRIDDLANEGGGREAKNWVYRVNEELATKACNKFELQADAVVRWSFENVKM